MSKEFVQAESIDDRNNQSILSSAFLLAFASDAEVICHAPGRVNLIGEHTDYNEGFVLPAAINVGTNIYAKGRADRMITTIALDLGNAKVTFSLDDIQFDHHHSWSNYLRGALLALMKSFPDIQGANLLISGNVPRGAGLSSSASFEIAILSCFAKLNNLSLTGVEAALKGQQAENEFVGCNCGIMDQLISALGKRNHAMLLDCRSLTYQYARIPKELAIVIVNSNVKRGLVDSEYNTRRAQCESAAKFCQKRSLRDVSLTELENVKAAIECTLYKRARHVITENERTRKMLSALNTRNLSEISQLMAQSHSSLKNEFEVTTPEIDALVEIMSDVLQDQGGVRMTGGGFGGCVVALAPKSMVTELTTAVATHYKQRTGLTADFYQCIAVDGAFVD